MVSLLLATLLAVTDPPGDTFGNGTLAPPTAAIFRATALFDVRQIEVPEADTFGFRLVMADVPGPESFPRPITEVYLHDATAVTPGQQALLRGSGMHLPGATGWHLAFRLVGDALTVYAPAEGDAPRDVTKALGARLTRQDTTLTVTTDLQTPKRFSLYGLTGSYDPFSDSGWGALRTESSPWSFSSTDQQFPVLDVIADTTEVQTRAIAQGVLPEIRASFVQERWLFLAGAGVLLALAGLAARFLAAPLRKARLEPDSTAPLAPLSASYVAKRVQALEALKRKEATLEALPAPPPAATAPELEPVSG